MKISGVIFDLDGTLLDSMPYWENVGIGYLTEQGIPVDDPEDLKLKFKTMTLPEAAEYYRQMFDVKDSVEKICRDIAERINDGYRCHAPLKEGVREVLDMFRQKNIPMSIATATEHSLVDLALKRLDIADYFTYVTTCGDLNTSKHVPFIFDECARMMHTAKEETVVFEDSLHSIVTASGAGYPVVGIYDASAQSEEQEIRCLSKQYLKSWKEFTID